MLTPGQIALVVVGIVLGAVLFAAWRFGRRYELNLLQVGLYCLYWPLTRFYWPTTYKGSWPLPYDQGAVAVCNHTSGIDPFFIQRIMPRMARWMVAKEYFRGPMGWFLRKSKAIAVSRSGVDTAATKAAIRHAEQGGLVGVLPEGRINRGEVVLLPGRSGAALVALKAGVPIVPCYVEGIPYFGTPMSTFRKRAKVRVAIGEPIWLDNIIKSLPPDTDEKTLMGEITLRCLKAIATLAGHPEFEPTLAGRRGRMAATETAAAANGPSDPDDAARSEDAQDDEAA